MIGELSFEWYKLSKRWMPRVVMLMLLAVIVLAFWGSSTRASNVGNLLLPRGWLTALIFASFVAPFLWPVLGASWGGNEYGWGTIRMVLTRRPFRIQHVLGALAVLLFGLALALLVATIASTVLAVIVAVATHHTAYTSSLLTGTFVATFCKAYLAAWVVASFFLMLAYLAAVLFRSAAVGIAIGIGSTLAEFVLGAILTRLGGWWQIVGDHLPVNYTQDLTTRVASSGLVPGSRMAAMDPQTPGVSQSLLAIAIYAAIFIAITLLALRTRDVTA